MRRSEFFECLTVMVIVALLIFLTPTMVGAEGPQSFPATPYKLLVVRAGERWDGPMYWLDVPTAYLARDVFCNPETRIVYWMNTDGVRRLFVAPENCSVWLEWRELEFSRFFLWWGDYEEVQRSSRVLGPAAD